MRQRDGHLAKPPCCVAALRSLEEAHCGPETLLQLGCPCIPLRSQVLALLEAGCVNFHPGHHSPSVTPSNLTLPGVASAKELVADCPACFSPGPGAPPQDFPVAGLGLVVDAVI